MRLPIVIIIGVMGFLLLALIACAQPPSVYEDVSHEPPYLSVVGKQYETVNELQIVGVTNDPNYRGGVEYYLILPAPGIGGPEILSKDLLLPGTTLSIVGFTRCKSCLFRSERATVKLTSNGAYGRHPVFMSDLAAEKLFIYEDDEVKLSDKFFRRE